VIGLLLTALLSVDSPPPLERCVGHGVWTKVVFDIAAPVERVFDFEVAEGVLTKVLKQYGPIPAVAHTKVLSGPWGRPGANRTIFFEDGSTLHEEITDFRRPGYFAYRISQFEGNTLAHLAASATGCWTFEKVGENASDQTHIEWIYSFEPKSWLARPVLSVFAHTFYHGFMRQALRLTRDAMARPDPPATVQAK
jgi:Polyketide cyclase / dehydrase and lipid transport